MLMLPIIDPIEVTTPGSIRERVARGAAWLDEQRPGWEHRIDLGRLAIESSTDCVCGQLDLWAYRPPILCFASNHGFLAAQSFGEYEHLNRAWLELIQARQQEAAAVA